MVSLGLNINAITSPAPSPCANSTPNGRKSGIHVYGESLPIGPAGLVYLGKMGLTRKMALSAQVRSAQHTVCAVDVLVEAPHNGCPFMQGSS